MVRLGLALLLAAATAEEQQFLVRLLAGGSPLQVPSLLLAVRVELSHEIDHLRQSEIFHGIEWYLPYFYEQPASLLDYLSSDSTLLLDDAYALAENVVGVSGVSAEQAPAPQTVKAGVSKDEAATLKAKLEEQGAVVEVK